MRPERTPRFTPPADMTASMESGPVVFNLLASRRGSRMMSESASFGISLVVVPNPGNFVACLEVIKSPPLLELVLEVEVGVAVVAALTPEACWVATVKVIINTNKANELDKRNIERGLQEGQKPCSNTTQAYLQNASKPFRPKVAASSRILKDLGRSIQLNMWVCGQGEFEIPLHMAMRKAGVAMQK